MCLEESKMNPICSPFSNEIVINCCSYTLMQLMFTTAFTPPHEFQETYVVCGTKGHLETTISNDATTRGRIEETVLMAVIRFYIFCLIFVNDPFPFTYVPNSVAVKGWKMRRLYLGQMH